MEREKGDGEIRQPQEKGVRSEGWERWDGEEQKQGEGEVR